MRRPNRYGDGGGEGGRERERMKCGCWCPSGWMFVIFPRLSPTQFLPSVIFLTSLPMSLLPPTSLTSGLPPPSDGDDVGQEGQGGEEGTPRPINPSPCRYIASTRDRPSFIRGTHTSPSSRQVRLHSVPRCYHVSHPPIHSFIHSL